MQNKGQRLWQPELIKPALINSVLKLSPRILWRNPVMLIVELGAILTTLLIFKDIFTGINPRFDFQICIWLWLTILFANFAEALAEGRGKAQAETLRQARSETIATRLLADGKRTM